MDWETVIIFDDMNLQHSKFNENLTDADGHFWYYHYTDSEIYNL